jgi:hypothetical protein
MYGITSYSVSNSNIWQVASELVYTVNGFCLEDQVFIWTL